MTTNQINTTVDSRQGKDITSDDHTMRARLPADLERCQVCGYRAVLRDGIFIHEAAALFPVTFFDCDNPRNHPFAHDSEPTLPNSHQPYTPITCRQPPYIRPSWPNAASPPHSP